MNKPTKMLASALVGGSVLLTAACGGGGGRPSVSDIQAALAKPGNVVDVPSGTPTSILNCVAKALYNSKLSDNAIKALVKGDANYQPNATDKAAEASMVTAIQACQPK